ncbi:hypothetical protein INT47_008900 [Mucor saturninus]|uniref:Transposase n=1 Tax=Mucor saturninus TaxID=64648 RepID=A0A8H7QJ91_9FUNG|nr:hypothetical protein INT47_008900 [Mucor saturninus]
MSQLTPDQKSYAVAKSNQGTSISPIARELNFSRTAIRRAIQRFKQIGSYQRQATSGRPKKFINRDKRVLQRYVMKNRRSTLNKIMANVDVNASINTFRKELRKLYLNSRIARKKPFINEKQRKRRLEFAKQHQNWSLEDWRKVIFTDESSFQTSSCSSVVRVRRRPNEVMLPSCLAPTFQSRRSSLSVWGGIGYNRRTNLVLLKKGERSSAQFINQVYEPFLKDFFNGSSSAILMEDNALIHTSKVARKWKKDMGIICLDWPPQSPDLNPIENVWMMMKLARRNRLQFVKNISTLQMHVVNEWKKIEVEKINKLIDSMPNA